MECGDFAKGFARVRCDECSHEYLLAFSCKGRWFCPSCHQKKVQMFGAMLAESILAAVPHRHFTFTIPKMLRPYFRFHRGLLKQLCRIAHQCVSDFLRDAFDDADGACNAEHESVPAIVIAIHTFGEYLDFHPHLHALVADGLFDRQGRFHVMRTVENGGTTDAHLASTHAALEQLFRARVIAFLVEARFLPVDRACMLRGWVHSGFQVHQSRRIAASECGDMERLAQYIIRNPFSVAKMQVNRSGDSILYRSGMNPKIKRNFQVFTACDFIAAITQHIPDKRFQMLRYYGWYSNKMRGQRSKRARDAEEIAANESAAIGNDFAATAEHGCGVRASTAVEIIEHLATKPRRIPSRSWRELIKKVWEVDPLLCPKCNHEMRIVSLINDAHVIERILRHVGIWVNELCNLCNHGRRIAPSTGPPATGIIERGQLVIEPWLDDPMPDYDCGL